MSLQVFYGLMAACGLGAVIALMFFGDGDDSGDSSGVAWIAGLAAWFVLGLGIGGSVGFMTGSRGWSLLLGLLAGFACVFLARKTVGSLSGFCKRNETRIPELMAGDVVIPLGDIAFGSIGKVESPVKKCPGGGGATCLATPEEAGSSIAAGTECVITTIIGDLAVIKKI